MSIVPTTYKEWEHCITVKCGTPLTTAYISQRIADLQNMRDYRTQKFIELWGEAHHARILAWFREAEEKVNQ